MSSGDRQDGGKVNAVDHVTDSLKHVAEFLLELKTLISYTGEQWISKNAFVCTSATLGSNVKKILGNRMI